MKSLIILGRQPALGLAELESLYGAPALTPAGLQAVLLDVAPEAIDFGRLGGAVKLARVLDSYHLTEWRDIQTHLQDDIVGFVKDLPLDGKLRLGISCYGLRATPPDINRTALSLKKALKITGRSVRVIPNKYRELNSAQVLHNQLTGATGCELVLVRHGNQTVVAQTIAEQDIEAYAARDQMRPKRDAKVGMLPPKLAQIIVNLAVGPHSPLDFDSGGNDYILDPFCGTGVLLQEALLMGYTVRGTDLDPRMVEYATKNLDWLINKYRLLGVHYQAVTGDATSMTWTPSPGAIACETYLGKPLTSLPDRSSLQKIMAECDRIHEKFLRNVASQMRSGITLCLAVPAWKTRQGFLHLKTLDILSDLGYTRKKFEFARAQDLIYFRPDQTVARELIVLVKA